MLKLKETIENTLINNLEIEHAPYHPTAGSISNIDFESIQRCSELISQEIKDNMLEFALLYGSHISGYNMPLKGANDLFTEFINQRYKKE